MYVHLLLANSVSCMHGADLHITFSASNSGYEAIQVYFVHLGSMNLQQSCLIGL